MAIRTGTIWDTLANAGSGAVAELVLRSHHEPADPQVPDGEQVLVVDQVRTLDRVGHLPGDSDWLRPVMLATLAARLAPRAAGAKCYSEGWVLLERLDAPAGGIPAGKKLGPAREVPVVDLELGTATWYTLVDLGAGEMAADWAARGVAVKRRIERAAEAERMRYLTSGTRKAMTYDAKHQEARRHAADPDPQAIDYPFAAAEAAVRGISVAAMIAVWQTNIALWAEQLGPAIEAAEQGAKLAVDAAVGARDAAALAAAEAVDWPAP